MRAICITLTGCLLIACGWVAQSFRGPAEAEKIIGRRSYPFLIQSGQHLRSETITVTIREGNLSPYCMGTAQGIDCDFYSDWLMSFANLGSGGWLSIDRPAAEKLCYDAMHTVPLYPDAVRQCSLSLIELRYREAAPAKPKKDE